MGLGSYLGRTGACRISSLPSRHEPHHAPFSSWSLAETSRLRARNRTVLFSVGLAQGFDGFDTVPDAISRLLGPGAHAPCGRLHHLPPHSLYGAVLLSATGASFSRRKLYSLLWGLAVVHVHHLLRLHRCTVPPDGIRRIHYLDPSSDTPISSWAGLTPVCSGFALLAGEVVSLRDHRDGYG